MEISNEQILFCLLLGFCLSYMLIASILDIWQKRGLAARAAEFHHQSSPNARPIPRLGGIALATVFAVMFLLPVDVFCNFHFKPELLAERWSLFGSALAMFGLGLWDDCRGLGAKFKLLGQLLIASAAWYGGLSIHDFKVPWLGQIWDLGIWSLPVTVIWLVALTNLINLIDGVDGLAGGICLMLMVLMSFVGGSSDYVSSLALAMVGALLGFLLFNFPPAQIYLGDGGAYFMGFLIGGLTIYSSQKGTVMTALIAPLFVLALPILDTSLAILRRGLQGLPLFRPDRGHIHHRLLQDGVPRRTLVLGAYGFTLIFLLLGLALLWGHQHYLPMILGIGTLAILLFASRFNFSRRWFSISRVLNKSFSARPDVQYALAQIEWLVLEGARARSAESLCEDTAFIARKLGFVSLRIRLENGEKVWSLGGACDNPTECAKNLAGPLIFSPESDSTKLCYCKRFRHALPGHPDCYLELQTPDLNEVSHQAKSMPVGKGKIEAPAERLIRNHSKFEILSDVLAEGWAKSLLAWRARNVDTLNPLTEKEKQPTVNTVVA